MARPKKDDKAEEAAPTAAAAAASGTVSVEEFRKTRDSVSLLFTSSFQRLGRCAIADPRGASPTQHTTTIILRFNARRRHVQLLFWTRQ
jgi:hypothetical protein